MSTAREAVHVLASRLAERGVRTVPGSEEARILDGLLDQVEDARAHREAEKLRARARDLSASATGLVADAMSGATMAAATSIDPYAIRDGQLVRKADGKPVTL